MFFELEGVNAIACAISANMDLDDSLLPSTV